MRDSKTIQTDVTFPKDKLTHDEINNRALAAVARASRQRVVEGFISSLTSRRLEVRSALGSYACGIGLPKHSNINPETTLCDVCHSYANGKEIDLNILNFVRCKFGGVQHLDPLYIAMDLELFESEQFEAPSDDAIAILYKILNTLRHLKTGRLSHAPVAIGKLLKSNKNERVGIISTLGYCGILQTPGYQPLYLQYTKASDREYSSYSKSDWPFPADLWLPEYGLNEKAVSYWFGSYAP